MIKCDNYWRTKRVYYIGKHIISLKKELITLSIKISDNFVFIYWCSTVYTISERTKINATLFSSLVKPEKWGKCRLKPKYNCFLNGYRIIGKRSMNRKVDHSALCYIERNRGNISEKILTIEAYIQNHNGFISYVKCPTRN